MNKWLRKLEGDDYVLLVPLVLFGAVMGICFMMLFTAPAKAQDTAPAWEYALMVYGNTDAVIHTGDPETSKELSSLLVPQNGDAANIALALNVMGNDGWELVDLIPGGSTIYLFKRQEE